MIRIIGVHKIEDYKIIAKRQFPFNVETNTNEK